MHRSKFESFPIGRYRVVIRSATVGVCLMLPWSLLAGQDPDSAATADDLFDAPAVVQVRVKSGRTFAGHIDVRSDAETLWLRVEDGRTTLWRPIAWNRVDHATIGEESFTRETLRTNAGRFSSSYDASKRLGDMPPREPAADESAPRIARIQGRVRALSIDVRFANWDADAEDDGLVAAIAPLDETGRPIPAAGTLTVELIGMTGPRSPNWAGIPIAPTEQRPTLETWTVQLMPDQFLDGVAHVRLPLTRGDPADDPRLGSFGVVRARFAVPGSDVVEAELDPVRLRPLGRIGVPGR